MFGPGSYPFYTVGRFRYHWFLGSPFRGIRQRLATFRFYLGKGLELHRKNRFDCIVAYSHMTTGLMGGVLKLLLGTKLVLEIATSPEHAYITETPRPGLRDRAMKLYSDISLHLSMAMADRAHFLYPDQLHPYVLLRKMPNSVFHEFVPVSIIDRADTMTPREQYVLMVGAPWYLKGADVLLDAFHELAADFPSVKLKIMGYYPDKSELETLTRGSPQVEILHPRPHVEALKVIGGAMIVVLPSRCEGLGRVLIEAMSAAIPVIGSNVGGIPVLVHDDENGFLFPVGDSHALGARLRQLLEDSDLRRCMGESGYLRAHAELDEKAYVRKFAAMVDATVNGPKAA
jgi:glycosyltransferase involved in cell wall biosynthesis